MSSSEKATPAPVPALQTATAAPPQAAAPSSAPRAGFGPGAMSPGAMLAMQRTMGNRAVQRRVGARAQQLGAGKIQRILQTQNGNNVDDELVSSGQLQPNQLLFDPMLNENFLFNTVWGYKHIKLINNQRQIIYYHYIQHKYIPDTEFKKIFLPFPAGIEETGIKMDLYPNKDGLYGAWFAHGFISSSGDPEAVDLKGIKIKEVISIGQNDLGGNLSNIDTAYTEIDEDGMITDQIGTNAKRIHSIVPMLKEFPAIYETPQKLYWQYPGDTTWVHLMDINIVVKVSKVKSNKFVVSTTCNGITINQDYQE